MADITSNLVVWYRFSDPALSVAIDSSGNNYHGTYTNTPTLKQQGPIGDSAISLTNAGAQYVVGPAITTSATNTVTYCAWLKPNGSQPAYGATVYSRTSTCGLTFSQVSGLRPAYSWNNDSLTYDWQGASLLINNVWSHVCIAIQATRADMYINGAAAGSNVRAHATVANPFTAFRVGSDSFSAARNYNGLIDDVRIYNRTLTSTDVLELYGSRDPDGSILQSPFQTVTGRTPCMIPTNTYPYIFSSKRNTLI